MRMLPTFVRLAAVVCLALALCACQQGAAESEKPIPYPIPEDSPFAGIQPGWSAKQVREALGKPTSTRTFVVGMGSYVSFIGGDKDFRAEDFYKGQGRIVYAGSSKMSPSQYGAIRIIYNEEESGYADKVTYPDGPHNKLEPEPKAPSRPAKKRSAKRAEPASAKSASPSPAAPAKPAASPAEPATPAPAPAKPAAPASSNDDPLSGL